MPIGFGTEFSRSSILPKRITRLGHSREAKNRPDDESDSTNRELAGQNKPI
jgi:hypothetical protein